MSSISFYLFFIFFLAFVLLAINLLLAPNNPYQEKDSAFECGFHSFLGQNRTQFSISFFVFALLFLLFDLEILLVYPYVVSAYTNDIYGLVIMLIFFLVLTLGFAFELGKKALNIDTRQSSSNSIRNTVFNVKFSIKNLFKVTDKRNFCTSRGDALNSSSIMMFINALLLINRYLCEYKNSLLNFINLINKFYIYLYFFIDRLVNLFRTNTIKDMFFLFKSAVILNKNYFMFTILCLAAFVLFLATGLAFFLNLFSEFFLFILVSLTSIALFNYIRSNWNKLSLKEKVILILILVLLISLDIFLLSRLFMNIADLLNPASTGSSAGSSAGAGGGSGGGPGKPGGGPGKPGGGPDKPGGGPGLSKAQKNKKKDAERRILDRAREDRNRAQQRQDQDNWRVHRRETQDRLGPPSAARIQERIQEDFVRANRREEEDYHRSSTRERQDLYSSVVYRR